MFNDIGLVLADLGRELLPREQQTTDALSVLQKAGD
jgi:hypothetical protein